MITEKEDARNRLKGALFGLILAVSSVMILRTINPQLTAIQIGDEKFKNAGQFANVSSLGIPADMVAGDGNGYLKGTADYTGGNPNVTKNISTYDHVLKNAAKKFNISCTALKAHAYAESGMNPNAKSPAGAQGLIQLMPATFKEQGVGNNPLDPGENTLAAASFISKLIKNPCPLKNKSDSCISGSHNTYAIAGYNAGTGSNSASIDCKGKARWECTINAGGYKETQDYVGRVTKNKDKLVEKGWGCD